MMKRFLGYKFGVAALFLAFVIGASLIHPDKALRESVSDEAVSSIPNDELSVSKILMILGSLGTDPMPNTKKFGVSVKRGESLFKEGISTKPGGGKTKVQSKHFKCTSCHNVEKEDPDLRFSDPQTRLEYTNSKGLPFLQGTTMYGAVNRTTFYNDDYEKKYGDLVLPARNNIRGAIQLCAVECAQGRKLKSWELESILAYLWTLDLKLADLAFSDEELTFIYESAEEGTNQDSAIVLIKSKYLQGSPAHFGTAYDSKVKLEQLKGNPENGQLIYENSCLHCHKDRKYSFFQLDNDKLTFKHLSKKANGYGRHSMHQVIRYGVYSRSGKRSYMPQYPFEKMSDQQLSDLQAYIDVKAQ